MSDSECSTPESFEAVRERVREVIKDALSKARLAHGVTVGGGEVKYWAEERLELRASEVADVYALLFMQSETASRFPTPGEIAALRKVPRDPRVAWPPYEEGWNDAIDAVAKLIVHPPSARAVVSANLMQALREQHAIDSAQRKCQHLWPHADKPIPASWSCACGTKVYRSYEDAVDD